jgi:hypothetical protein
VWGGNSAFDLLVENCTFRDSWAYGVYLYGSRGQNLSCHAVVRNCIFNDIPSSIEVRDFDDNGSVLLEDLSIRSRWGDNGITIIRCGSEVTVTRCDIIADVGVYCENLGTSCPTLDNIFISDCQVGIWVINAPRLFNITHVTIMNSGFGIVADRANIRVTNSTLQDCLVDFFADMGTIDVFGSSHNYRCEVEGANSWVRENRTVVVRSIEWRGGPSVTEGSIGFVGSGIVVGELSPVAPAAVEMVHFYANLTLFGNVTNVTAVLDMGGDPFFGVPFNLSTTSTLDVRIIDHWAPRIWLRSPENGSIVIAVELDVRGTFLEKGSGIEAVQARVDDEPWMNCSFNDASAFNVTLRVPGDGTHNVDVLVRDRTGLETSAHLVNITTDVTPPVIEVLEPRPWVNHPQVLLLVRTEPGASAFLYDVPVKVSSKGLFSKQLELSEGFEAVRIRVVDPWGNSNETIYRIELDRTPPFIVLDGVQDGDWLATTTLNVSGYTEDGTTIHVNGGEPQRDDQAFWHILEGEEGPFDITIRAVDRAGNPNDTKLRVYIDLTPPEIALIHPPIDHVTKVTTINVTGTYDDRGSVRVFVNYEEATVTPSLWYIVLELVAGENVLNVRAVDAAGNEAEGTRWVLCDPNPPNVDARLVIEGEEHMPGSEVLTNAPNATIVIDVDEACSIVYQAHEPYQVEAGQKVLEIPLEEGLWQLHLRVTDVAGNQVHLIFEVRRDSTPPVLDIVHPHDGDVLEEADLMMWGEAEVGATLTIVGKPVPIAANGTYRVELVLEKGENVFDVALVDRAGNWANATISVSYIPAKLTNDDVDDFPWTTVVAIALLAAVASVAVMLYRRTR